VKPGGGAYVVANIPADPTCAAKVDTPEERQLIYADGTPPPAPPALGGAPSAVAAAGAVAKQRKKCKRHKKRRTASPSSRGCKRPRS
jgi:hypothetical protein